MTDLLNRSLPSNIAAYIDRLSVRERFLILGAAFVVLTLAPLKAYDLNQTNLADYIGARADLDAAIQAAARSHTATAQREIAEQKQLVQRWELTASTLDIGRVLAEEQVALAAQKAGFTALDVKATDVIQQAGPVSFVSVDVSGPFSWAVFDKFIHNLAATGRGFYIQSISVELGNIAVVKITIRMPVYVDPVAASTLGLTH
jgi:hypothetical protein